MEAIDLTILGNYRPFTDQGISPISTPPPAPTKQKGPKPFHFGPPREDGIKVKTGFGAVTLPHYELFPPTIDDFVSNEQTLKSAATTYQGKTTLAHGYDVELTVDEEGTKVTWSQGGVLRKIFTFENENETIRQVLFAWFRVSDKRSTKKTETSTDHYWDHQDEDQDRDGYRAQSNEDGSGAGGDRVQLRSQEPVKPKKKSVQEGKMQALVVVLERLIKIYYPNGEENVVCLRFGVERVWAMEMGILLEIKSSVRETSERPVAFYMLVDPFEEEQSVLISQIPDHSSHHLIDGGESQESMEVQPWKDLDVDNTCVFVSHLGERAQTVVTYDRKRRKHRFWAYTSKLSAISGLSASQNSMDVDGGVAREGSCISEMYCDVHPAWSSSQIFTAHAIDGSTVICVLDKSAMSLATYQVAQGSGRADLLWTAPAISAVGVVGTRYGQKDILLLCPDRTLSLWTGFERKFLPCRLPINLQKILHAPRPTLKIGHQYPAVTENDLKVIEFRDAVEDRASAVLNSGHVVRFHLDFQVRVSVVQESLDALCYALPLDLLWEFRYRFILLQFGRDERMDSIKSDEWTNFASVLLSFCAPSSQPLVLPTTLQRKPSITQLDMDPDWEFFLNSPLRKKMYQKSSVRGLGSDLPPPAPTVFSTLIDRAQELASMLSSGPSTRNPRRRVDMYYKYALVALHLVHEDRSLNVVSSKEADMVPLLMLLSKIVRWDAWVDYYVRRDFSPLTLLASLPDDNVDTVAQALFDEGYTITTLNQLQTGISIVLKEALWRCRQTSFSKLGPRALAFIGRHDLAELQTKYNDDRVVPRTNYTPPDTRHQEPALPEDSQAKKDDEEKPAPTGTDIELFEIPSLRFGEDKRIQDTQMMLQSSRARTVRVEDDPNLNEDEQRDVYQETLAKLAQRTLALPIGRAALTFSVDNRPIASQKLPIPPVNLDIKIAPGVGLTKMDDPTLRNEDTLHWAHFHNAVAAALRISPDSQDVTDSWMRLQYPGRRQVEEDKGFEAASHGGVLFGLGITGHLRSLGHNLPTLYLATKRELYTLGLLFGLACAYRGTMDDRVIKLLTSHMPSELHEFGDRFDLSPMVQEACFVGMGLLHSETCSAKVVRRMTQEIALDPRTGPIEARAYRRQECHSLSAGFGLGWTTLGQGDKKSYLLADAVETLHGYLPRVGVPVNVNNVPTGRHRAEAAATAVGATIALGLMYLRTNNKLMARKLGPPDSETQLDYVTPASLQLRVICRSLILWDSILPMEAWVLSQIPDFLKNDKGGPSDTESGPQAYYSMLAGACFAIGLRFAGSGLETVYNFLVGYMDRFTKLGRTARGVSFEERLTKATVKSCLDVVTMATALVVAGSGRVDFLRRLRAAHQRVKGDTTYGSHLAYHLSMGLLFLGGGTYNLGTSNHCVAALFCSLYPRLPSFPADNRTHNQAFRHLWVMAAEPRCLVTRDFKTGVACPIPIRIHLKPFYDAPTAKALLEMTSSLDIRDRSRFPLANIVGTPSPSTEEMTRQEGDESTATTNKDFMPSVMEVFTPCLLPELSTITKIELLGPRYFPMSLEIAPESRSDLTKIWRMLRARSVSVIRRTAYLSYSEDNLGSRGIIVRPFPVVLTSSESTATSTTSTQRSNNNNPNQKVARRRVLDETGAWELIEGLAGNYRQESFGEGRKSISPLYESSGEVIGRAVLQDPKAAAFARNLCLSHGPTSQNSRAYHDWATRIDWKEVKENLKSAAFHTEVLYECLIMEKTEALVDHMWLYNMESRLEEKGELDWQTLWDVKLLKAHYESLRERHDLEHKKQTRSKSSRAKNSAKSSLAKTGDDDGDRFVQDDGSETLIRMQRISDLYNRITSRVDRFMGEEKPWGLYDRMDPVSLEVWKQFPGVREARYYFAMGAFRPKRRSSFSKTTSAPSPLWLPERLATWESGTAADRKLLGSPMSSPTLNLETNQSQEGSIDARPLEFDLLKVWLALYDIPGPRTIREIIEDMDKFSDHWDLLEAEEEEERVNEVRRMRNRTGQALDDGNDSQAQGSLSGQETTEPADPNVRSGATHHKMIKMWSVAYPGISPRLLRYLRPSWRLTEEEDEDVMMTL
ncbi:Anaphase-promoting complex subunit 1 [Gryganskiella cystojenkinii]|nr:Anaphase-promoting complex subunit 1 [Gryganskiella cystojenkinii]